MTPHPSLDPAGVVATLQAIADVRPELASALSSCPDADLAAALATDGLPAPPRIDAPLSEGRPLATFILGAGRGGVARGLLEGLRDGPATAIVVVVETDPARLLATLIADDWDAVLAEPRFRFAVGSDLGQAIAAAIPETPNPLLERGLNPGVGLVPGDEPGHAEAVRRAFDAEASRALGDFKGRCAEQAARHPAGQAPRLPEGPWRIHTSVSTATTAIKHLGPSILNAAARAGHHASIHLADTGADPFVNSDAATAALESEADLVLGFLRPGSTVVPWRQDFPSLVLVSSNPKLLPIETFPWNNRDLVVVTEPDFTPPYEALGLDPLVRPLATEVPERARLTDTTPPACEVLVVGNIPDAASVVPGLSDSLRTLIEGMADDWVRHPTATFEEVVATTTIKGDEGFMAGIRLALGYEATRRRRIGAVIELAAAGVSIRVHGEEAWAQVLAGTPAEGAWHGWMPAEQQHAAFHQAGACISVNSFAALGSLNMRSFAVPAAAGLLISDDRPPLHDAFEIGREALCFQRLDELPDLVADTLRDRDRRDAMAEAGRTRVERDHSWDAWWAWAEARLRERFGS